MRLLGELSPYLIVENDPPNHAIQPISIPPRTLVPFLKVGRSLLYIRNHLPWMVDSLSFSSIYVIIVLSEFKVMK